MKRELPKSQKNYIKRIKQELNNALYTSKYSYTQLQEILEERYGFVINKGTLQDLFNVENSSLNYACLVTVCHFFGFDFNQLLGPEVLLNHRSLQINTNISSVQEKNPNIQPFIESLKSVGTKFTVLRDDGYMGKFKGYIVTPTRRNSINEFNLELYKDKNGIAHANLIRHSVSNHSTDIFEYSGIPYHCKAYQSVIIFLVDKKAKGEFYFLSFGFQQYRSSDGLLFRQGLAVTGKSLRSSTMITQNFILFDGEISPENLKYVPGLLKSPVNEFCISVETVERLAEEHSEIKVFLEKFSTTLSQVQERVYVLNEDNILSQRKIDFPAYDRIKALLLLKGAALLSEKNDYVADNKYSGFIRDSLLRKTE